MMLYQLALIVTADARTSIHLAATPCRQHWLSTHAQTDACAITSMLLALIYDSVHNQTTCGRKSWQLPRKIATMIPERPLVSKLP